MKRSAGGGGKGAGAEARESAVPARTRFREIDLLAFVVALACCVLAWSTRYTLNADGVSYLDLAQALNRGEWSAFVQGYWSPLYPAMIAAASRLTGATGLTLLPVAHLLNALTAVATIVIIWRWARPLADPFFGRAALAAFLLSSARLPRVEAVTPDLLVLCFAVWLAYELLHHGGRRWLLVGALLGLMFLGKTSAWPWLAVAVGVRWWGARDPGQRRALLASTAVCAAVMLAWVVPLSQETGHPTLGSAARLNYCWYIAACDSRTPDTHAGGHTHYGTIRLADGREVAIAKFDASPPWTYQPWGDPTAWAQGVLSDSRGTPSIAELLRYWGALTVDVVWNWLALLLGTVLAPMYWAARRPGLFSELRAGRRGAAVVMILGVVGIAQFIAVHAEPRLIAPFAMLLALAALSWFGPSPPRPAAKRKQVGGMAGRRTWQLCSSLGLAVALGVGVPRLRDGITASAQISSAMESMRQAISRVASGGAPGERLAVVGPAMPMMGNAYMLQWRVVAQVRPSSSAAILALPQDRMQRTLDELFGGIADAAWLTLPDGRSQVMRVAGAGR